MSVTPNARDMHPPEAMALMSAGEITITMKLDEYHAIQKTIAESNWTRGQTRGQRDLIAYLFHIVVTKEIGAKALVWDRMPAECKRMLDEVLKKAGVECET